ncbi:MAG: hypothetical protein LBI66_04415 [Burkholderiaceae bacterium]|jgi:hypothetical protein|nr:hypothetical protein [Burkholderiaceae bacterium]
MQLQKTAKALEELQPGRRSLPQRARSLLLMADRRPEHELHEIFGAEAGSLIQQLIDSGHLLRLAHDTPAETPPPRMAPVQAAATTPPPAAASALNLAGTRMYLFDLCERMFANRHEDQARVLRELLREARDLPALQAAALSMLEAVQHHAGEERAQALRERLQHLLQQEAAAGA